MFFCLPLLLMRVFQNLIAIELILIIFHLSKSLEIQDSLEMQTTNYVKQENLVFTSCEYTFYFSYNSTLHKSPNSKSYLFFCECPLLLRVTLESFQEMETELMQFAGRPEHQSSDSTFLVFMSHGILEGICGVRHRNKEPDVLPDDTIFTIFNNSNCRSLRNKPKILIMQACRGSESEWGSRVWFWTSCWVWHVHVRLLKMTF